MVWLPCAAAWLALSAAPAPALQEPGGEGLDSASQAILRQRERGMLHPGDPLVVVGLEQEDNDLRSRTPALAKSDGVSKQVDPEEAYQRALALYADGATFHAPPAALPAPPGEGRLPRPTRPRPPGGFSAEDSARHWPWMLGVGMTALLVVWVLKRRGVLEAAS